MIGICYRYTANRQLAEDLAHDAFLKAIDKAGSFKGEGVFEAWLRRVVVNHVLTYIRDQKRHQRIDDWFRYESTVVHTDENSVITDSSEDAEFSAQELWDAINDLPEHHRLVFNLYVIDVLNTCRSRKYWGLVKVHRSRTWQGREKRSGNF